MVELLLHSKADTLIQDQVGLQNNDDTFFIIFDLFVKRGNTALMLATWRNRIDAVESILTSSDQSVNVQNQVSLKCNVFHSMQR